MIEEFEGNIPNIMVESDNGRYFWYVCVKTKQKLRSSCYNTRMLGINVLKDCYECLGYNRDFMVFYRENAKCSYCGAKLDFGYFIFIYLLEKASLLPKNFKMFCCVCDVIEKKKEKKELTRKKYIQSHKLLFGIVPRDDERYK